MESQDRCPRCGKLVAFDFSRLFDVCCCPDNPEIVSSARRDQERMEARIPAVPAGPDLDREQEG